MNDDAILCKNCDAAIYQELITGPDAPWLHVQSTARVCHYGEPPFGIGTHTAAAQPPDKLKWSSENGWHHADPNASGTEPVVSADAIARREKPESEFSRGVALRREIALLRARIDAAGALCAEQIRDRAAGDAGRWIAERVLSALEGKPDMSGGSCIYCGGVGHKPEDCTTPCDYEGVVPTASQVAESTPDFETWYAWRYDGATKEGRRKRFSRDAWNAALRQAPASDLTPQDYAVLARIARNLAIAKTSYVDGQRERYSDLSEKLAALAARSKLV